MMLAKSLPTTVREMLIQDYDAEGRARGEVGKAIVKYSDTDVQLVSLEIYPWYSGLYAADTISKIVEQLKITMVMCPIKWEVSVNTFRRLGFSVVEQVVNDLIGEVFVMRRAKISERNREEEGLSV